MNIEHIVKPENDLERLIISQPEFIEGSSYGKPRKGHQEGAVINHIKDVLANVDKFSNSHNRSDLRIITLIHDTLKYQVDNNKPKEGENHHAMRARRFAEKIGITNSIILNIIELHDEAFNAWSKGDRDSTKWEKAKGRAIKLINKLDNLDLTALDLYLTFFKCDNNTSSKEPDSFIWFEDLILKMK